MKRLYNLIFTTFIGPFLLTFAVVVFIFLLMYILKYLDEILGKGIPMSAYGELFFYFGLNKVPDALPLVLLLAGLMTYGSLGEHNELTAIKSGGISLVKIIFPLFVFAVILSTGLFFFNNYIIPKINLKAYSLLWDMRHQKPSFSIKEGVFYNDIPPYSIKVGEKLGDEGDLLKNIMIYDHSNPMQPSVTLADSGRMYFIHNENYLVFELYEGHNYTEMQKGHSFKSADQFVRHHFKKGKFVFDLSSMNFQRTKEELFANNKYMKNIAQIDKDTDSLQEAIVSEKKNLNQTIKPYFRYLFTAPKFSVDNKTYTRLYKDGSKLEDQDKEVILKMAVNQARGIKGFTRHYEERTYNLNKSINSLKVEKLKKYVISVSCILMFLIGASLGAIVKKGGLGIPTVIGVVFFIVLYVLSQMGEKWAKEGVIAPEISMWAANAVLLPLALFFLIKARNDSRLFELDYYFVFVNKVGRKLGFGKR